MSSGRHLARAGVGDIGGDDDGVWAQLLVLLAMGAAAPVTEEERRRYNFRADLRNVCSTRSKFRRSIMDPLTIS